MANKAHSCLLITSGTFSLVASTLIYFWQGCLLSPYVQVVPLCHASIHTLLLILPIHVYMIDTLRCHLFDCLHHHSGIKIPSGALEVKFIPPPPILLPVMVRSRT